MSRKPYRRHTKSAHKAIRDRAFEVTIGKPIALSKVANLSDSNIPEARSHHAKI
jgi:hypothetical protein